VAVGRGQIGNPGRENLQLEAGTRGLVRYGRPRGSSGCSELWTVTENWREYHSEF
jgi:hypothetical protein